QPASRHEPDVALRSRQPLDPVLGDENVLLEPDVSAAGDRSAVLEREHVSLLDEAERGRSVAVPSRSERRPAVVRRAPELMAEGMHRLRVYCFAENRARGGVDLPAGNAGTQRGSPRV